VHRIVEGIKTGAELDNGEINALVGLLEVRLQLHILGQGK